MVKDVPGNHSNGFLPILDTQMAVIGGLFRFQHYLEPMSFLEVTLHKAAMRTSSKLNILTQEGNKRIRDWDLEMASTLKVKYMNRFMVSMVGRVWPSLEINFSKESPGPVFQ